MSSEGYHEPVERLQPSTIDRHRAVQSIMEELEAIDWYDQRVDATTDPELAAVLGHNRDEEKEHAAMTIEWLRRHDPVFDRQLRTYLFTEGPILEIEDAAEHGGGEGDEERTTAPEPGSDAAGLGIGSLKGA